VETDGTTPSRRAWIDGLDDAVGIRGPDEGLGFATVPGEVRVAQRLTIEQLVRCSCWRVGQTKEVRPHWDSTRKFRAKSKVQHGIPLGAIWT
jgi:hypothetical protein